MLEGMTISEILDTLEIALAEADLTAEDVALTLELAASQIRVEGVTSE